MPLTVSHRPYHKGLSLGALCEMPLTVSHRPYHKGLSLGSSTPGYCIHETLFDDVPWRRDVIDEDVRFSDGLMYPSNRPGLGIELDESAAAAHPKSDHWLRHYVGTLTNIRPPDSMVYYHS